MDDNKNGLNDDTKVETPVRPVYDEFMYEPIGFEDYDRISAEEIRNDEIRSEKKLRERREKAIVVIFGIIMLTAVVLSVYGICHDMIHGKESLKEFEAVRKQVILYQNSKPKGSDDPKKFVDENGKYTTEGVASAVQSSIVEIYTYKDPQRNKLMGTGSGVVLSEDGYIVTNAHVLQANGYHSIHTVDDKVYSAKIVGRDSKTDIAIIKVGGVSLTPAILGNSDEVVVGEQVIAVGNPAGLSNTVTDGIVSAINRKIRSDNTGFQMNCIQTNADISPGNSGGALVNMYGQVIGITSSKYVSSSYEGLGFAITINDAKPIIEELISKGFISGRFRIGITMIDMSTASKIAAIEDALGFSLPNDFEGIYINDISEDSDIKNTELKTGDFITAINGKSVKTYDEFYDTISSMYSADDIVPATCAHVDKDGKVDYYSIKFRLIPDTSGDY